MNTIRPRSKPGSVVQHLFKTMAQLNGFLFLLAGTMMINSAHADATDIFSSDRGDLWLYRVFNVIDLRDEVNVAAWKLPCSDLGHPPKDGPLGSPVLFSEWPTNWDWSDSPAAYLTGRLGQFHLSRYDADAYFSPRWGPPVSG